MVRRPWMLRVFVEGLEPQEVLDRVFLLFGDVALLSEIGLCRNTRDSGSRRSASAWRDGMGAAGGVGLRGLRWWILVFCGAGEYLCGHSGF